MKKFTSIFMLVLVPTILFFIPLVNKIDMATLENNKFSENKEVLAEVEKDQSERLEIAFNKTINNSIQNKSYTDSRKYNIGDLFVLDKLFDNGDKLLDTNSTSVGDLFILNEIFNEYEISSSKNKYSIGDLFILDKLFNSSEYDLLDSNQTSLSDILILNQIFNR